MANIIPNIEAQVNLGLFNTNLSAFAPTAKYIFEYNGPATPDTDDKIKSARLWLQNMIDLLPKLMEALNDTPTSGK